MSSCCALLPQYDIDPMRLPQGMDEELDLLDALDRAERSGLAGSLGKGAGLGEEDDMLVTAKSFGSRSTSGKRKNRLRSLGDAGEGEEDVGEEDELIAAMKQQRQQQQQQKPQQPQEKRVWGASLMRKYNMDEFRAKFPNKEGQ